MVCSACGYENQSAMRFCGMCGTPLPHRPLTTPGAQSTLTFTRVPLEPSAVQPEQKSAISPTRAGVMERPPEPPAAEPPAKELVPDVPLDEYLRNFRYEPPKDTNEFTMHGEAPPAVETTPEPPVPANHDAFVASKKSAPQPAAEDSVVSRLGLEPESEAEAKIARPRFLDINAPEQEAPAANSGTSTIVGPSFLGLSDAPQVAAQKPVVDYDEPPRSHWRAWLALAIVVLIAALALLEWSSQAKQNGVTGPVQYMRMKMHQWQGSSQPQPAAPAVNPATAGDSGKPEMQVEEQPKKQAQPAPDTNSLLSTNHADVKPQAASGQNAAPAPQTQPVKPQTQTAKPQPAPTNTASGKATNPPARPKAAQPSADASQASTSTSQVASASTPSRRVVDNEDDVATRKEAAPGAEEMQKAKNASDSVAAAAWLWKATAKGNPDAPVQLADMYVSGNGVPRSCEQALVLLKTAAAKENAAARSRLASMYATGNCVQRNRVEAYRWLSSALAANPNSQWAQQNRDLIWRQMTPEEQAAAQQYR